MFVYFRFLLIQIPYFFICFSLGLGLLAARDREEIRRRRQSTPPTIEAEQHAGGGEVRRPLRRRFLGVAGEIRPRSRVLAMIVFALGLQCFGGFLLWVLWVCNFRKMV